MMLGVLCVEMRWFMVIEVHRDHDAVEGADPGHDAMMSDRSDTRIGGSALPDPFLGGAQLVK